MALNYFKIDKDLLYVKLIYVIQFMGQGTIANNLQSYYRFLGCTEEQMGIIGGVLLLVNFGSGIWGSISDKFGIHKFILMITCLGQTLIVISMFFVGYFYKGYYVQSVNESQCNATYIDYPGGTPSNEYIDQPYSNPAFWYILFLAPAQNFMYSSVRVITDTGAMNILGEERKEHYGKQRLWGSIGYAALAALSTMLISKTCNIYSLFYTFAICNIFFILTLGPFDPKVEREASVTGGVDSYWKQVKSLLNAEVLVFNIAVFIMGLTFGLGWGGVYINYFYEIGADQQFIAIYTAISPIIEVFFFFVVDLFITKLGNYNVFYLCFLAQGIVFLASSFITVPWYLLPLEILSGFVWSNFWGSLISLSEKLAPSHRLIATLQGMSSMFLYFGGSAGAFIGGALYRKIGIFNLFRIWSGVAGFGLLFFVISNCFVRRLGAGSLTDRDGYRPVEIIDVNGPELDLGHRRSYEIQSHRHSFDH